MFRIFSIFILTTLMILACKNSEAPAPLEEKEVIEEPTTSSDFKLRNLSGQNAYDIIYSNTVQLLDVRTHEELIQDKRLIGARNFDINKDNFKEKLASLDKRKAYLVYCKSGIRSARACEIMHNMGFLSVYNLEGGYDQYKSQGFIDY